MYYARGNSRLDLQYHLWQGVAPKFGTAAEQHLECQLTIKKGRKSHIPTLMLSFVSN